MQGKAPKEIHAILTETLGEHAPSYVTIKNWLAQFKSGDFPTCDAPRLGRPKTVTTPEIIDQIHELFLEDRRILSAPLLMYVERRRQLLPFYSGSSTFGGARLVGRQVTSHNIVQETEEL